MTAGGAARQSLGKPGRTRTLVLGLGNPILGDDGVGIVVAREAERLLTGRSEIETRQASFAGLDLVELLAGFDCAILVDAIKTPYGEPGAVYKLDPDELPTTDRLMATHEISLTTALGLGGRMGLSMPREVVIYAVEVEDDRSFGDTLTPKVASAVGPTAARVAAEALAEAHRHVRHGPPAADERGRAGRRGRSDGPDDQDAGLPGRGQPLLAPGPAGGSLAPRDPRARDTISRRTAFRGPSTTGAP